MTKEQVIELAKQAGCEIRNGHAYNQHTGSLDQMLKRFAKLVRNAALDDAYRAVGDLDMPPDEDNFEAGCTYAMGAIRNLKGPTP